MQFRIIGTERDTGQGVAKVVPASNEREARSKAEAMNVEVQKVQLLTGQHLAAVEHESRSMVPLWSPGVAALLSFLLPGAGQIYKIQIGAGLLWLVGVAAGYTLVIPGIILHVMCIYNASRGDPYKRGG